MSYNQKVIFFSIECFNKTDKEFISNGIHSHVLKNKYENFFGTIPTFKFHRWAGSLKSSQAFAYNIFSGITGAEVEFEYSMWALDKNPLHKANIDVAIKTDNDIVRMYEVKMFEIIARSKKKIFHSHQKYFEIDNYQWNKEIAKQFINFLHEVEEHFIKKNKSVYGEGLKQLCCHLLGIINEITTNKEEDKIKRRKFELKGKTIELYSLCYDNPFLPKFKEDIVSYKETLEEFKFLADKFFKEIDLDTKITCKGYLSAREYISQHKELLGEANYKYVMNRYF